MPAYPRSHNPKTRPRALPALAIAMAMAAAVAGSGCSVPGPETVAFTDPGAQVEPSLIREEPEAPAANPELNKPDASYADMLMAKAKILAAKELGRMSAAELTYRNTVTFQELSGLIFAPGTGNYMKVYRSFTDFDIKDIYRSESFIYPVAVEIEFEYEFLNTQPRSSTLSDAKALSGGDTRFSVAGTYTLTRRYRCDGEGNYIGRLPELPPRANYHQRGFDRSPEPNAAQPNRLPPGGPAPGSPIPIGSQINSLPPTRGGAFP